MPSIEGIFYHLPKVNIISRLDLKNNYWQIADEERNFIYLAMQVSLVSVLCAVLVQLYDEDNEKPIAFMLKNYIVIIYNTIRKLFFILV